MVSRNLPQGASEMSWGRNGRSPHASIVGLMGGRWTGELEEDWHQVGSRGEGKMKARVTGESPACCCLLAGLSGLLCLEEDKAVMTEPCSSPGGSHFLWTRLSLASLLTLLLGLYFCYVYACGESCKLKLSKCRNPPHDGPQSPRILLRCGSSLLSSLGWPSSPGWLLENRPQFVLNVALISFFFAPSKAFWVIQLIKVSPY